MGLDLIPGSGQTPLDQDERDELRVPTISTRAELDEFEHLNIRKAVAWSESRRFTQDELLSESFLLDLHRRMFSEVWRWAGNFRTTNKNLGVDKHLIATELRKLLDDCRHWVANNTFEPDETAVRLKHRLVSIHCFPNGNGRHARLHADLTVSHLFGRPVFSWGSRNLVKPGEAREAYLRALREADGGDIAPLVHFARS